MTASFNKQMNFISKINPDIIVLQEAVFSTSNVQKNSFEKRLNNYFLGYSTHCDKKLNVVLAIKKTA